MFRLALESTCGRIHCHIFICLLLLLSIYDTTGGIALAFTTSGIFLRFSRIHLRSTKVHERHERIFSESPFKESSAQDIENDTPGVIVTSVSGIFP